MTDEELNRNFEQLIVALNRVSDRLIQIDRGFEQVDRLFDRIDKRFERIDERFAQIDERFERVDERFQQIDERFEETIEFARGIETSLLKEFRKCAISFESRHKAKEILVGGFNERLIALEERVGDLERHSDGRR
jgi:hypothetical protein